MLVIGASNAEMPRGPTATPAPTTRAPAASCGNSTSVPQPGEVGHETWLDDGWKDRSGTNMWIWYTTADPDTDTLYITIGSPSPNYYGGDRPGLEPVRQLDRRARCPDRQVQVALPDDPPRLVGLGPARPAGAVRRRPSTASTVPALAETGKPGLMYILNRETGEPIHGVEERPVAAANVPGEWYSPTQPFPVKPAQLNRGVWTPDDVVTAQDTTPGARRAPAAKLLDSYGGTFFNQGSFTPFFLHKQGDPPQGLDQHAAQRRLGVGRQRGRSEARASSTSTSAKAAAIGWIEKRDPKGDYGRGTAGSTQLYDRGSLIGPGAYSVVHARRYRHEATGETGADLPCIRPPWGRLMAVDANTGEIALGRAGSASPRTCPRGKRDTGTQQRLRRPDRHRRWPGVHRCDRRPLLSRVRCPQRQHPVGAAARTTRR